MTAALLSRPRAMFHATMGLSRRPVVANAASLFGSTLVTSFLGFAFWAVAARLYSTSSVGFASSAISGMQFLGNVGMLGLGTLVIAEVRHHPSGSRLIAAAIAVATVASALLAVVYVLVASSVSVHLGALGHGVIGPGLFITGVALTGFTLVLDQACIGLQRGGLQLTRNTVFSVVKLALLPAILLWPSLDGAVVLYTAWLLANVVSLGTFVVHTRRLRLQTVALPDWGALFGLRGAALGHHWLNLSSYGARLLLPVVATSMLGPQLGAAFFAALLVVTFANIIPIHLSTALFSIGRGHLDMLARESRVTLRLSAWVALTSGIFFVFASYFILRLLGPDYVIATPTMIILGFTTMPLAVKAHYMAISRVRGSLTRCAMIVTAGGIVELAMAAVGGKTHGLTGLAIGYAIAITAEGVLLWPIVARAAGVHVLHPFTLVDQEVEA